MQVVGNKLAFFLSPLTAWLISVCVLLTFAVLSSKTANQIQGSQACTLDNISTPKGLGTLGPFGTRGYWRLQGSAKSGNALATLSARALQSSRCGFILHFSHFDQSPGYESQVFFRTSSNVFIRIPIAQSLIGSVTIDLADRTDVNFAEVMEWGMATSPVHQKILESSDTSGYVEFSAPKLVKATFITGMGQQLYEWTAFAPWTGSSINVVDQNADDTFNWTKPQFVLGASLFPALLLAILLFHNSKRTLLLSLILPAGVAWAASDFIWHQRLSTQNEQTKVLYEHADSQGIIAARADETLYRVAQWIKKSIDNSEARIFVAAPTRFKRERLYYHLLPRKVVWLYADWNNLPLEVDLERLKGDYLVILPGTELSFSKARGLLLGGKELPLLGEGVGRLNDIWLVRFTMPKQSE